MNVIDALDTEWAALTRSRALRDTLVRWGEEDPALDIADPAALVARVERRDASPAEADRILAALAARAPVDDTAARVLLQLLLPGCKALVRRYFVADWDEGAATVVALAYDRIRTYPIERRPARVAANVLLDVRQRVLRSLRRAPSTVSLRSDRRTVGPPAREPATELAEVFRWALRNGHLDERAMRLIVLTRLAGVPVARVAADEGTSEQTLRQRRLRAERRLRRAVAA
jgi:hypothetical protein